MHPCVGLSVIQRAQFSVMLSDAVRHGRTVLRVCVLVCVCVCVTSLGDTGVCVDHPGPSAGIPFHFLCGPLALCNLPHYSSYTRLCSSDTHTHAHTHTHRHTKWELRGTWNQSIKNQCPLFAESVAYISVTRGLVAQKKKDLQPNPHGRRMNLNHYTFSSIVMGWQGNKLGSSTLIHFRS